MQQKFPGEIARVKGIGQCQRLVYWVSEQPSSKKIMGYFYNFFLIFAYDKLLFSFKFISSKKNVNCSSLARKIPTYCHE